MGKITIAAFSALLLGAGLATPALAADHYAGPVIDTHAHPRLTDDDGLLASHPKGIAPLRALDQAAHVERSALIVIARQGDMAATRAQNDAVIAAAASDPQHFYPIASVHPADGDAALVELERLAKLGVKVIKLHPNTQKFDVADPAVAKVTDKCGQLGLAVLFDSYSPTDGDEIGKLMMLSFYQPKTQFIFAHMGFSHFREIVTLATMRKLGYGGNVWLDISAIVPAYAGSPVQPELVWTLRQHGMDHVLFGSDWPVDTPEAAIAAVRALGLTAAEEQLVLHDNAAKLLGLK
ncbi:putative TIM-barrel fold metal-dependent hydrolase [Caulobacter sp. AP07]|uniref:amidohydrolase family protein n=1 Tax=Caulobacter sp. AP07 TaxID=1144304 RepID=UPI000271E876|nr:amidohydrolase family protein [Caulobacter sp. AP07]EJL34248.1 putative TIM-barrel fold metal-dependent hydrolase [Caulobacter sp. AP07]